MAAFKEWDHVMTSSLELVHYGHFIRLSVSPGPGPIELFVTAVVFLFFWENQVSIDPRSTEHPNRSDLGHVIPSRPITTEVVSGFE